MFNTGAVASTVNVLVSLVAQPSALQLFIVQLWFPSVNVFVNK